MAITLFVCCLSCLVVSVFVILKSRKWVNSEMRNFPRKVLMHSEKNQQSDGRDIGNKDLRFPKDYDKDCVHINNNGQSKLFFTIRRKVI